MLTLAPREEKEIEQRRTANEVPTVSEAAKRIDECLRIKVGPRQWNKELYRHRQRQHQNLVPKRIQEIVIEQIMIEPLGITSDIEALHIPSTSGNLGMTAERVV